jgi:Macrocin-O-methyltransferase (TylF)
MEGAASERREIRASPARPQELALRTAYLELLKLCLCDLVASSTTEVQGLPHGRLVSRELAGDERSRRAEGRDWPLHALTMTGLRRLDDLQSCVETVVRDEIPGDLIETGSWRGGSSILMRATLDTLSAEDRTVWVADSFQGFPDREPGDAQNGYATSLAPYFAVFDFLAVPLEEVQASFVRLGYEHGVRFVPGFFEETLPGLAGSEPRWSVIRLDGDTYDVTLLALRCLYPSLSPGGYLIVDDYLALDECRQAVEDFRREHRIEEPLEQVDWTCARWRRGSEAPIEPYAAAAEAPSPLRRAVQRPHRNQVPTERELALEQEVEELHDRMTDLQAELGRARAFEDQLREVTTSTSWRWTRPLRELSLRLKRSRR